ncbi:hypothetical protein [Pyxidicoccus trucidator]|uniref:hypothetical protein n=1 Tax=Pyxidicoccus trucidator TaxID=2709662 RepID=UPI0013DAE15F|nr:hypothetical protein [Pyxidicoccus trucidator]
MRNVLPWALALLTLLSLHASAATRMPVIDRRMERPAAMVDQHGQLSVLQRTIAFPAGTNAIEFDYFVDSEEGKDFLRVYVNDLVNPVWSMSGLNRRGRMRLNVAASGNVKVRFAYQKDAAGTEGTDTAWVDDVAAFSSGGHGRFEIHRFDALTNAVPVGWLAAGFGGGWQPSTPGVQQSVARPGAQAGKDNSASYMERTLTWSSPACTPSCPPWKGTLEFDAFVDSEAGDRLNVYIFDVMAPKPGPPVWSASGRNQASHVRLNVGAGTKKVRFAYVKNGSGSEGLDTARVDRVTVRDGAGRVVEAHDFSGRTPDTSPIRVGSGPVEWTGGGTHGGWTVVRAMPNTAYVPSQQVGQAWAPDWAVFAEPVVDGVVRGTDLKNATRFLVVDQGNPAHAPTQVALVHSKDSGSLYASLKLAGNGAAPGEEGGTVTLWLDDGRLTTLQGQGCPASPASPGPEDRRLRFSYTLPPGETVAKVTAQAQGKGTCTGAFDAAHSPELWGWTARVSEPADELGTVHVEVRVQLPAGALAEQRVGLGLKHEPAYPGGALIHLPFADDGVGPTDGDVWSWETVSLAYTEGAPELSENPYPACCYPYPSRPGMAGW